ncbi:MCE family protein [Intrasporangium sp.]|uniref:MCE family protein n=1 Tax=Intrasporangium sp. TaxID=1925024 RepID=UPI00293A2DA7|nr:MCE family protein [Intrasporangium sp.]MDV3220561.1 MCE family protein [Intrasporangium sp.]
MSSRSRDIAAGPLTQHTRWRLGLKAYGVIFIVVVTILLGLSVAAYQKRFTPVVLVSLETTRLGSQLQEHADVKLRGLVVGEVRSIEVTATGARLGLALHPEHVAMIPADVSARLLPKTLFGERYVDLVLPRRPADAGSPAGRSIAEGDVIGQDRSRVAIELETVLDNLDPLLRAVQPAKLATTLGSLSSTLEGRGDAIGEHVEILDDYVARLNRKLPALQEDIGLLADTLDLYDDLSPDLFRLAESLRVTNRTIVEKDQQLAGFFVGTAGLAHTLEGFLRDNEERIIQVGQVTRPTSELLARYAPNYPCFTEALVNWIPRIEGAFANERLHITLETVPPRDPYHVGEEPQWLDKKGPNCAGLPSPDGSQADPYQPPPPRDGSERGRERPLLTELSELSEPSELSVMSALPSGFQGGVRTDSGASGTAEEQQVVAALLARDSDSRPSGIQTLLAGPLLRGTVVSNR